MEHTRCRRTGLAYLASFRVHGEVSANLLDTVSVSVVRERMKITVRLLDILLPVYTIDNSFPEVSFVHPPRYRLRKRPRGRVVRKARPQSRALLRLWTLL